MVENWKKYPDRFTALALFLLADVGLWLFARFGACIALRGMTAQQRNLILNVLYYGHFIVLPVAYWTSHHKDGAAAIGCNSISVGDMLRSMGIALTCLILVMYLTALWTQLLRGLGIDVQDSQYVRPDSVSELLLSVVSGAIIAPIAEELLFRGMIFSAYRRQGALKGVWVSAVLFALMHASLVNLPGALFVGVVLALAMFWSESLLASLTIHTLYNAYVIVRNYLDSTSWMQHASESFNTTLGDLWFLLLGILAFLLVLSQLLGGMRRRYLMRTAARMGACSDQKQIPTAQELRECIQAQMHGAPQPMSAGTMLVLMAGIVSSGARLTLNVLKMLGG